MKNEILCVLEPIFSSFQKTVHELSETPPFYRTKKKIDIPEPNVYDIESEVRTAIKFDDSNIVLAQLKFDDLKEPKTRL